MAVSSTTRIRRRRTTRQQQRQYHRDCCPVAVVQAVENRHNRRIIAMGRNTTTLSSLLFLFLWLAIVIPGSLGGETEWQLGGSSNRAEAVLDDTAAAGDNTNVKQPSKNNGNGKDNHDKNDNRIYTAFDDASWAITSSNVSSVLFPTQKALFEQFRQECTALSPSCPYDDERRLYQNVYQPPSMINYTQHGFQKIRAPEPLFRLLQDFWHLNRHNAVVEYNEASPFHNAWQVPTTIVHAEDASHVGGGRNLTAAVWTAARTILEDWTGLKLAGSSVYGIRVYHNQSTLSPHVDRLPLVASAIINVDQDVEEDWMLEVYGHNGKATNVSMKPGDMVLYESHSVVHGRPFSLNGKFYANIFVHFQPMGGFPNQNETENNDNDTNNDIDNEVKETTTATTTNENKMRRRRPPYLIPNSPWEERYFEDFPKGWTLLWDWESLAENGDVYTLQYIHEQDPTQLRHFRRKCWLILLALEHQHVPVLEFLLDDVQYDINLLCRSQTPLDYAQQWFGSSSSSSSSKQGKNNKKDDTDDDHHEHAMIAFFQDRGGVSVHDLARPTVLTLQHRCELIEAAVEYGNDEVLEFLFVELEFPVNLLCVYGDNGGGDNDDHSTPMTPLDLLYDLYRVEPEDPDPEYDDVYAYLLELGALEYHQLSEQEQRAARTTTTNVDRRCDILPAAVAFESVDVLRFLMTEMNFDVNFICHDVKQTVLDMAYQHYFASSTSNHNKIGDQDQEDAVIRYLLRHHAQTYYGVTGYETTLEEVYRRRERCGIMTHAIETNQVEVVQFLLEQMPLQFHVNMMCQGYTLLDWANFTQATSSAAASSSPKSPPNHDSVLEYLIRQGGSFSDRFLKSNDQEEEEDEDDDEEEDDEEEDKDYYNYHNDEEKEEMEEARYRAVKEQWEQKNNKNKHKNGSDEL